MIWSLKYNMEMKYASNLGGLGIKILLPSTEHPACQVYAGLLSASLPQGHSLATPPPSAHRLSSFPCFITTRVTYSPFT